VVWTAEFADAGWIVPLDPSDFPIDQFFPQVVQTAKYRGRLYAVPYTSNAGLLFYRSDLLRKAGVSPPRTWAQLSGDAATLGKRYHIAGYAGQFAAYEGLTVNYAEAVQSEGGAIMNGDGTKATVDSPQGLNALLFLVDGIEQGWIPRASLNFQEQSSANYFNAGKLVFLRNWPFEYGEAEQGSSKVNGKVGVETLPGPNGPGSSSLGGSNLAISAFSQHQKTALAFIQYMTSKAVQEQVLTRGSLPPVWRSIYEEPGLERKYPYLKRLEEAITTARPRPETPNYSQVSLTISSTVYAALKGDMMPEIAVEEMAHNLQAILSG
jgi:multiple sugar transport system substrate-binding protein